MMPDLPSESWSKALPASDPIAGAEIERTLADHAGLLARYHQELIAKGIPYEMAHELMVESFDQAALQVIREGALEAQGPIKVTTNDDFPRAEVLWLVKRLERSEYERGQMKAENRRLLRRLRKLRHKRGKR